MFVMEKKRSDVVWIMSDIFFSTSYVVFPAFDIVFGGFGKAINFGFAKTKWTMYVAC